MQPNLLTTQARQKEIVSTLQESTQLSRNLVSAPCSSVTRLLLDMHPHSTESTFAALFLTVEQALERAAEAQLFELNDELTRANFKNIVEPYLRDVQAKRGLYGFLVVCDSTNNTPDVIDNNEFRADIFLKPTKSINYVTLTFVATRTGISFEEVAGTV